MPNNDERRIREGLQRLMASQPPTLDPEHASGTRRLRTVAVGIATFVVFFVVLGTALVLNHRTAGNHNAAPFATPSASPETTAQPTASAVPSATPTPSSFLSPTGPACSAATLEMRVGQQGGAGGNGVTYLIFTDRGSSPCVLRGTPTVQFLDSRGRVLRIPSVRDSSSGMFPTYPNNGVGLLPLPSQGTPPGPLPEGGVRGQASLPLQYAHDGCANALAAVRVGFATGNLTVSMTIPGASTNCALSSITINPFQPAEFMP